MNDLYKIIKWKCEKIIEWSSENQWFDNNFILDIYNKIENTQELSEKQISSIENIYSKFCKEL